MENEQKMPTGMKIVLAWLYLGILASFAAFVMYDDSSPLLGSIFLASSGFGLITNLCLITSIHARKWWKVNIALMGLQLFETVALSLYKFPALLEGAYPATTKLLPAGVAMWNALLSVLIIVVISLIILIYVYKHRSYFYKDSLIINH